MVFKISGAFFFRATARVLTVLDRLGATPRLLVLDFAEVPPIDTAAARFLVAFVNKAQAPGHRRHFRCGPAKRASNSQSSRLETSDRAIRRHGGGSDSQTSSVKTLWIDVDLQPHIAARLGCICKPFPQVGRQIESSR